MEVTYVIFSKTIVVNAGGRTFTISKDDKRFRLISELITQNNLAEISLVMDPHGPFFKVRARILESIGLKAA